LCQRDAASSKSKARSWFSWWPQQPALQFALSAALVTAGIFAGHYIGADPIYVDGKWIEVSYGGPIKRSRDLWGSGATYGRMLMNGAPTMAAKFQKQE
jgi:hypothetical protein